MVDRSKKTTKNLTSTRSGLRFGKFCSTSNLLCVFLTVAIGLGCSAFALSSYGSGGVSDLIESVFVPDAASIPVLDLSNTTPENEFSPTVHGTAFASSAALPTETETARGALSAPFNPAPDPVPVVPDATEFLTATETARDLLFAPRPPDDVDDEQFAPFAMQTGYLAAGGNLGTSPSWGNRGAISGGEVVAKNADGGIAQCGDAVRSGVTITNGGTGKAAVFGTSELRQFDVDFRMRPGPSGIGGLVLGLVWDVAIKQRPFKDAFLHRAHKMQDPVLASNVFEFGPIDVRPCESVYMTCEGILCAGMPGTIQVKAVVMYLDPSTRKMYATSTWLSSGGGSYTIFQEKPGTPPLICSGTTRPIVEGCSRSSGNEMVEAGPKNLCRVLANNYGGGTAQCDSLWDDDKINCRSRSDCWKCKTLDEERSVIAHRIGSCFTTAEESCECTYDSDECPCFMIPPEVGSCSCSRDSSWHPSDCSVDRDDCGAAGAYDAECGSLWGIGQCSKCQCYPKSGHLGDTINIFDF